VHSPFPINSLIPYPTSATSSHSFVEAQLSINTILQSPFFNHWIENWINSLKKKERLKNDLLSVQKKVILNEKIEALKRKKISQKRERT